MGFLPVKSEHGAAPPWEYLPAKAAQFHVGQVVEVTGGLLAPVAGAVTKVPTYICMHEGMTVYEGQTVPVIRVSDDRIYETTLAADAGAAEVGGKLQVSVDGLQVESGDGAFEIVELDGAAAGDTVRGRFVLG